MRCKKKSVLLPRKFAKYFWDCDLNKLDLNRHIRFITERILNFGDPATVRWLLEKAGVPLVRKIALNSRRTDKKTKNFWKVFHGR
jgi:hypothetical protein